ncbi:ankyrin repeat protein (macronuclear) [Tetrahymena thermophila SB210]|uniref:Ankyrin repeat protein n=1 Tax=Tetrahymena thermophila (strain SB210) TaxID=312017 RepID=Q23Q05_TETTS|nr:ankyrin repeat protein [Tetrahymena thermophila SB210]EAR98530.2 ankyrin repeat protein [Tetrahymena thermophila SB210]|eukprot:XP_001018775.2 ankyrin repeat protein [Tetrahymena thermophila SB210]
MEEQNITTNISAIRDTSKQHLDNSDIQNYTHDDRYNVSFSKSQRKKRKKSLAIQDIYYNYEQQQKEITLQDHLQENDKSTIEYQAIQCSQQRIEQKVSPNQNKICFKGISQENESANNEIDLFQKPQNSKKRNTYELPTLKIQIKRSTNTNVDGEELQNSHISSNASPGLKRWKKLSIVMKSIQAFQKSEIKNIQPNDIEEEIKNSPSPRKKKEESHKVFNYEQDFEMIKILDNYRRIEELCQLCKNGSPQDLEKIKSIIQNDPKRYIRSPDDPEHLINKLNSQGFFPLYIACMNQNIEIVKFLLKIGAIPSIKTKNQDTCLEVAARWRYVNIVQILLQYESKLDTRDLENSRRACGNHQEIDEQIHQIILKRSNNIFKYCFPCFF